MRILLPDKTERIIDDDQRTVESVLLDLGFSPNEVIVTIRGKLVPEDTVVSTDDEVRIIRVSHGG
jgi:sulfur carrier protein ThiS